MWHRTQLRLFSLQWALCLNLHGAEPAPPPRGDLTDLSLEQLMNIEVTSVSKRSEKLSKTPAAVTVLTQDDLRRSGVRTLPDALRLVPGVQVAQVNAHTWGVSARGFNTIFANKLLVMIDGRSIYTPLFSGVYWNSREVLIDDIDRIEVVRGPGADLWGANAVNGVIHIVPRSAKDTQGTLITAGGGTEERGFASLRHGGQLGNTAWYRASLSHSDRDERLYRNGTAANDAWRSTVGDFQLDWEPTDGNALRLTAGMLTGRADDTQLIASPAGIPTPANGTLNLSAQHVLARWTREFSPDSALQIQAYFDRTDRDSPTVAEERHTADLTVEHRFAVGDRQEWAWGVGYRYSHDEFGNNARVSFAPAQRSLDLFSAFLRDTITLREDRWKLLLGSHLEHNDLSGAEVQPSARLLFTPNTRQTFWAAVSRAVRTPSRAEHDMLLNQPAPTPGVVASIIGNRNTTAETLLSYQLGWRAQLTQAFSLQLDTFYNDYDDLVTFEPSGFAPGPPPRLFLKPANLMEGETYGFEISPTWQIVDGWRLQAGYSFIQIQLQTKPGSRDTLSQDQERQTPHHQFTASSTVDLPHNLDLTLTTRYVDNVPNLGIPAYLELDARISWRPSTRFELSLVGQNLLDNQHPEFGSLILPVLTSEVQRAVYGKVTLRF